MTENRAFRKTRIGQVVSDKMDKTIVVAVVKNLKVMFEIGGVSEEVAREALRLAQHKLPVKTRIITKDVSEIGGE